MKMFEAMRKHFTKQPISLHVPGHHYQTIGNLKALDLKYDITEISGMDDYHHAKGVIKHSEELLLKPGYHARFLVNGTTVGLLAVIISCIESKDAPSIAIMRNAHKSIYNAINLGKGSAYILPTEVSKITQEFSGVNLEAINESLLKNIKLAVLTYPNYYGETYDIASVIEYFHSYNIPVLVDEAHGAHFDITDRFPNSTLNFNADFVVQSFHKTLPAFTMSSVMYMNNRLDDSFVYRVNHFLSVLQSSSPSYLLMLGLEHANEFFQAYKDDLFFERRKILVNTLRKKFNVIEVSDPLKIMIAHNDYTGRQVAELLEKHGIYTELSNEKFVLCVLPLWHIGDHYLFNSLVERIDTLHFSSLKVRSEVHKELLYNQKDGIYISQENKDIKECNLEESEGYKVADNIIPYPPGIPYILAGENIRKEHIEEIAKFLNLGGNIHGVHHGKIRVIE